MNVEERNIAAISHLGAIIPLFGLFVVFLSFLSRKEKSPEFQFQLLQAFVFQLIEILFVIFMILLYLVGIFGSLLFSTFLPNTGQPLLSAIFPLIFSILFFAGIFIFISFSGIAAINLLSNKDFHFPLISFFLKKYIKNNQST